MHDATVGRIVAHQLVGTKRFLVERDRRIGVGHRDLWRRSEELLAEGRHDADRFAAPMTPTRRAAATIAPSRSASAVVAARPASVMR